MKNKDSLDSVCGALCYALGIAPPLRSALPNDSLCRYIDESLAGQKVSRVFMYNPDAVAEWLYHKLPHIFKEAKEHSDIEIPLCSVMPSVTPVCFGTLYTGAQPDIHGIKSYTKPVITIDTFFDALIRSSKKAAIISTSGDSMSKIFLERDMDYFIYDTIEQVNAKACELIIDDSYDFIAVYNGNYDSYMHKFAPLGSEALGELRCNVRTYGMFCELIAEHWKAHDTLVGFAMDHGCHEIDGGCGSHGLDMEEDLNIIHLYKVIKSVQDIN